MKGGDKSGQWREETSRVNGGRRQVGSMEEETSRVDDKSGQRREETSRVNSGQ